VVIKVMNYIIRHIFALSNGWSAAVDRFRDRREHLLRGGSFCPLPWLVNWRLCA
jgi:hypothetical protein